MTGQVKEHPENRLETAPAPETPRWYILNHIGMSSRDTAQKAVDGFNAARGLALELFAPTYVVREVKDGETRMRTVSLTFHYVFVKGAFADVKELCGQPNGFSFLIDRAGAERYATVGDREMAGFKNIARAYSNCLPYFPLDDVDLEEGDLVEVVKGDFPGLVGTYMPNAKSSTGNIVLHIYNNTGTIAFNVRATDVRVLEFSRKSTRANDQIDAFVPHILKALRLYSAGDELPVSLLAKLSVFSSRMGSARLHNRKLDAKLQALLYASYTIIGDRREALRTKAKYDTLSDSVTNEWTLALINLIFTVTDGANLPSIAGLTPVSKAQRMIADEYEYYLAGAK